MLKSLAENIMALLNDMPEVKACALYGSLSDGQYDELSDIDINVDVSGHDNGRFMLTLAERLSQHISVYYNDYAPSLVPEKYIVSIAIDEEHPTRVVDLCCVANPHCTTVDGSQIRALNDKFSHMLKLWTANWKHHIRGTECRGDILRMAEKIGIENRVEKSNVQILEETLAWLEVNAPQRLWNFVKSCRREYTNRAASL